MSDPEMEGEREKGEGMRENVNHFVLQAFSGRSLGSTVAFVYIMDMCVYV